MFQTTTFSSNRPPPRILCNWPLTERKMKSSTAFLTGCMRVCIIFVIFCFNTPHCLLHFRCAQCSSKIGIYSHAQQQPLDYNCNVSQKKLTNFLFSKQFQRKFSPRMEQYGGHRLENTWLMQSLTTQMFKKWSSPGMDLSNILKLWLFHIQR